MVAPLVFGMAARAPLHAFSSALQPQCPSWEEVREAGEGKVGGEHVHAHVNNLVNN